MSFAFLSPTSVALGLAVLAGAVFLLQRLRVRHRELVVPTTLFWREALEESQARKLTERFRHPWAFLLLFAIAALLFGALAGPRQEQADGRRYVVLVDASAAMAQSAQDAAGAAQAASTRLDAALARTAELLAELPRERTRVVLCGATPRTLLGPGEASDLFELRSAELVAEAAPSTIAAELERLASARRGTLRADAENSESSAALAAPTSVLVLSGEQLDGDWLTDLSAWSRPLDPSRPETSTSGLEIQLIGFEDDAALAANAGITAFGIGPASSGAWDRVDLMLEVQGALPDDVTPALDLDGQPIALVRSGAGRFLAKDLIAAGGLLSAQLPADALPHDDRASLRLPERQRIAVQLAADLPPAWRAPLASAIAADPGLVLADDANQLGAAGVAIALAPVRDLATLVLRSAAGQPEGVALGGFVTRRPAGAAPFRPIFEALALQAIDADLGAGPQSEAAAGEREQRLASALELREERLATGRAASELWLDGALFEAPFDLVEGRAFPLLVGLGLRWLVGNGEVLAYSAAGRPLPTGRSSALGLAPFPARAGVFSDPTVESSSGSSGSAEPALVASLLSPDSTTAGQPTGDAAATDAPELELAGGDPNLARLLILLALALLLAEWFLVRTRRVP